MEKGKAKLNSNTPESSKSDDSSTPSSSFTFEGDSLPIEFSNAWFSFQGEILSKQIDDLLLKYNNCFVCLQDATAEENHLQEENLKLRAENLYLSILVTAKENEILEASVPVTGGDKLVSEFGGEKEVKQSEDLSVKQSHGEKIGIIEKVADTMTRGIVPKAISVRSSEFLAAMNKGNHQSVAGGDSKGIGAAESSRRLRLAAKPFKNAEDVEELQVYKQGMSKTELCNKWEETGNCPYEGRCHFAHGVEELRPVIRHPRYKTEICRMISSGGTCPYGHRCHFRHSLDPNQEKEVVI